MNTVSEISHLSENCVFPRAFIQSPTFGLVTYFSLGLFPAFRLAHPLAHEMLHGMGANHDTGSVAGWVHDLHLSFQGQPANTTFGLQTTTGKKNVSSLFLFEVFVLASICLVVSECCEFGRNRCIMGTAT